jgi:arylsulfatase A-like enzyme
VVAAGGVAPSKRSDQAYYYGLMHAVDWMPTLAAVAGYKPEPKTSGIKIDGINHWMSIAANATSPCVHLHESSAVGCCTVATSHHTHQL